MQIVLHYDPLTGYVSDKNSSIICSYMGLENHELLPTEVQETVSISHIMALKTAGFTAQDIIDMSAAGLL